MEPTQEPINGEPFVNGQDNNQEAPIEMAANRDDEILDCLKAIQTGNGAILAHLEKQSNSKSHLFSLFGVIVILVTYSFYTGGLASELRQTADENKELKQSLFRESDKIQKDLSVERERIIEAQKELAEARGARRR